MRQVQVRAAGPSDARALAVVHVETWRTAYRGLLPDRVLDSLDLDAREARWREVLAQGGTATVAEQDAALVGFCSYGPSGDEDAGTAVGELLAIYVMPTSWGSGVGRQLHDVALRVLAGNGMTEATLWVLDGNERARRFYEQRGWTLDGRSKTEELGDVAVLEVRYRVDLDH